MPGRTDSTRAVAITPPKPALKILSRARSGWFKYLFLAVDASTSLPALPDGENNDKERTRNPWEQGLSWCGAKMDHLPWLSQTKSTISSLRAPVVQLSWNISTSGSCLELHNRVFFHSVSIYARNKTGMIPVKLQIFSYVVVTVEQSSRQISVARATRHMSSIASRVARPYSRNLATDWYWIHAQNSILVWDYYFWIL